MSNNLNLFNNREIANTFFLYMSKTIYNSITIQLKRSPNRGHQKKLTILFLGAAEVAAQKTAVTTNQVAQERIF